MDAAPATYTVQQMADKLAAFEEILGNRPPYCSGSLPVSKDNLVLFYGKEYESRRLDFSGASGEDHLEELAQFCQPAAFGVRTRRVLDEQYRKAGKVDAEHFSLLLDVHESGLIQIIRDHLLSGDKINANIRAERYKLNVYGKDSFFKSHKDTPRGQDMFGSLVIVLPTPHEGGELILRDKGNEWTFDSAAITDQQDTPSLAFVAFYGDVEHEVMKVTSGYRVSITYNLYTYENHISPPSIPFTNDPTHDELKATFEMLLSDSSFLPIGGYLGFGLRRQYAFQTSRDIIKLAEFEPHLKGSDAILFGVSKELSLSPALIVYFKTQEDDEDELDVICYNVPVLAHGNSVDDDLLVDHLCDGYGGRRVKTRDDDHFQYRKFPNLYIHWATPLSEFGNVEREYPAYGNEPSLAYAYGCICLLIAVGPYGEREATHKILPLSQKPVVKKVSKKPTGTRGGKTPKSR